MPGVLLVLVTAALVIPDLTSRPFWLDEAYTVANSRAGVLDIARLNGGNMVGYYALVGPLADGPLDTLLWLRLPSALAAIVVPAACYKVLGLVLRPWHAFAAGLLVALHPVVLSHAHEARSYPIAMLLVVLAWGAFIRAVESDGGKGWVVSLSALLVGAAYMHLITLFTLPAMLACAFYVRPAPKQAVQLVVAAGAIVSVLAAPLLWWSVNPDAGAPTWIPPLHLDQLVDMFYALVPSRSSAGSLLWLAFLATGVIVSLWRGTTCRTSTAWRFSVPAFWLVVPIVLIVTVSLAQPILHPRYVLYTVPAIGALTVLGLASLPSRYGLAFFAVLVASIVSAFPTVIPPYDEAFHWPQVSCDIAAADPEVLVVFPFSRDRTPVDLFIEMNPDCTPVSRVWPEDPWGSVQRTYSTRGWDDLRIEELPEETWVVWRDLGLAESLREQVHTELRAAGFERSTERVYGYSISVERWQAPGRATR